MLANLEKQVSRKYDFFLAQENDIQAVARDTAKDANRVHGFDKYVSAIVP